MNSPKQDLNISLVQTEIIWHEPATNCIKLEERLSDLANTDIIVLPEMFNSGFTLNSTKVAESMSGDTVQWMLAMAKQHDAAVTGSLVIEDQGKNYNRMIFAKPDGNLDYYDKRHLFRMANEQERYAAGNERKVVHWRGWEVALLVCYDLRFPVWCRTRNDVDLMLFVASWPAVRSYPWQLLLRARAMENLCYVCGVNRIGTDANDIAYSGDSAIVDMMGKDVLNLESQDRIITHTLKAEPLEHFRTKFPAWMDSDEFTIR